MAICEYVTSSYRLPQNAIIYRSDINDAVRKYAFVTRLSVSPITGYDSITMTMMPCAKSHNQRISMRRFAISHAIKIRSKIYEKSRIWISSEHSYIIPLYVYIKHMYTCIHNMYYYICINHLKLNKIFLSVKNV